MAAELLVLGGGRMGEALVAGLLGAGWARPEEVVIAEAVASRRAELSGPTGLAGRYPGLQVGPVPVRATAAVVAVKPADVEGACRSLATSGAGRVLSVAAGVSLAKLEAWCPAGCAVVRAMPNTAVMVGAGAAAISAGSSAGREDIDWAASILRSVGSVVEVPEHLIDAVTGLSGSGPAYLFLIAEAMIEGGVLMGLPRPLANDLTAQTLLGAAKLLRETGQSPESLHAAITSPGGTTAAGLRALEARRARSAIIEAIAAATERSRELAG